MARSPSSDAASWDEFEKALKSSKFHRRRGLLIKSWAGIFNSDGGGNSGNANDWDSGFGDVRVLDSSRFFYLKRRRKAGILAWVGVSRLSVYGHAKNDSRLKLRAY